MKTYMLAVLDNETRRIMAKPILTCSLKNAILWKQDFEENNKNKFPMYHIEILMYDIKTQGKNFGEPAFAEKIKEPF